MTSRERTIAALAHSEPDHVPVCLAYETPAQIADRYGVDLDSTSMRQDIFGAYVDFEPAVYRKWRRLIPDLQENSEIDSWGISKSRSSTHDTYAIHGPLRGISHANELADVPFPSIAADSPEKVSAQVADLHAAGYAVQGSMSQTIFELAWGMRGMERLMIDFTENPGFVDRLFDRITSIKTEMALCFARAGVDILRLGDDVGTQHGMMMSPDTWREFLKPRLAEIIHAARAIRPDIPVFYHSDGDIRVIVEELIEIGVTILNPIQPECMDPFEIKRRYGSDLTLWGAVGTQSLLPFGTPEEIRNTVHEYIEVLGDGGGYVIGPTHSINRDVSWENIAAFYDAVAEFG